MKLTVETVRTAILGLTAALVLGIASLGVNSLSAHAEPTAPSESCFTADAQGIAGIFFAGESTMALAGTETTFRCDGTSGLWQQVSLIVIDAVEGRAD